jgi:predicted nucleotidyltransferase
MRRVALQVMEVLEAFQPYLYGSVLRGNITPSSDVDLMAHSDDPDLVGECLLEADYEVEFSLQRSKRRGLIRKHPHYFVHAAETVVEISVYPCAAHRHPPRSTLTGRGVRRASITAVRRLLQSPAGT